VIALVTISGSYGAGGSRVGPALAQRLEVPFLDRAIPAAVAEHLAVPFDDAEAHDDRLSASWLDRMLRGFIGQNLTPQAWTPVEGESGEEFRRATEEVLLRTAASGRGVILGRAAAIVLREEPRVLRVRLDGPPERRVRQAMELEGLDEATARDRRRRQDRAHATYARHFYGVDTHDPALYHLMLDSTAIPLDVCVELLATAARSFTLDAPAGRATGEGGPADAEA
jgi:cytidylate kinase